MPVLEFEFFLADKLGRTVGELRASMTNYEFGYWYIYHARIAQRREMEIKSAKAGINE